MNFSPTPRKYQGATLGSTPAQSRFRSSLVPMSRPSPSRSFQPAVKPTRITRTTRPARDLFGTATPKPTRSTHFAPTLPPAVTKAATGARKFAAGKNTGAGMAATTSTELFKMRIPEPDAVLTGEALAKSIPEALTRKGTVYADQYLADKCPAEFDDLQRRQFFCILDLRRLKHAANEIFAKKDWKLNILNFAKEYEKSRGLIMLHYGLYEFKNVKPSEEVMRRWRAAHGLPNPEPEKAVAKPPSSFNSSINTTPGPGKRKADDDPQPGDNTLKASTANQNKKRNVEQEQSPTTDEDPKFAPSPTKSKRKTEHMEEDLDESQRNKMQRTPSSARSRLEGIINNVQAGSTTPAGTPIKRPALDQNQSLFASKRQTDSPQTSPFAVKSNPFASTNGAASGTPQLRSSLFQPGQTLNGDSGSVLSGHKFGIAPAPGSGNIFGYLSESSAPSSGNEKEDEEDEPETESESENEQGSQDVVPSEEPSAAASTGTATPPIQGASSIFNLGKPSTTSASFGTSTKPAENASKGGLFGRVSFGSDGQPLRAAPTEEAPQPHSLAKESVPEPVQSSTPAAKAPGDFTFNPATTPINFSSKGSLGGSSIFAAKPVVESASAKPTEFTSTNSSSVSSLFGAKPANEQPIPSAAPSSQPLFGNPNQTSETGTNTPNGGSTQSIFGTPKPVPAAPSVFSNSQRVIDKEAAAKEPAKSIFGAPTTKSNAEPAASSTPLFAGLNKPSETGQAAANGGMGPSIFSGNGANPTANNVFGAPAPAPKTSSLSKRGNDDSESRPVKRSVFGKSTEDTDEQPPKRGSLFGTSQPETTSAPPVQDAKPIFGGSSTLFGSTAPKSDPAAPTSSFASNASAVAPVFQFGSSAPSEPKRPDSASATTSNNIFGTPAPAARTPSFTFGAQSTSAKDATAAPSFSFGAQSTPAKDATAASSFTFGTQSTPARDVSAAPSPVFSFGGTQPSAPAPSFGGTQSTAAAPSFGGFGPQANGSGPAKIDFNFSGSSTPGGNSSSFVFGGDQNQASNTGSFTFTAGGPSTSNTNGPSFGGASNTTTPAGSFNFQFGGPSTPKPAEQGSSFTFGSQPNEQPSAPGFSFTSSTPQAAPSKAPSVFGGLLQPGGGTSTGASSPFPAPSSLNTTPVNGTPEPQTQEDGEEAPQEQISLTERGLGEEDEQVLHEVRAKATKYVPVVKDDDGDEENKSPWQTQGVGPLRVLKNKTTGVVRILLRGEPRGHIAMNKTILADFQYKPDNANKKTMKIMAAKDDGSGLETWVLQVKKPESTMELAAILEAHKGANKK